MLRNDPLQFWGILFAKMGNSCCNSVHFQFTTNNKPSLQMYLQIHQSARTETKTCFGLKPSYSYENENLLLL